VSTDFGELTGKRTSCKAALRGGFFVERRFSPEESNNGSNEFPFRDHIRITDTLVESNTQ